MWPLFLVTVLAQAFSVVGPECPAKQDVLAALAALTDVPEGFAQSVEIIQRQNEVWLILRGEDGRPERERRLPSNESCAQQVRTAAVVLAAWSADLRGPLLLPDLPPRENNEPPPRALPREDAAQWWGEKSFGVALLSRVTSPQALGLALGGRFGLVPLWHRLGLRLSLAATLPARTKLNTNADARWLRVFAAITPSVRVTGGPFLDIFVEAGVALAYLTAEGQGLMTSRRDGVSDFAILGGLHAQAFPLGRDKSWALTLDGRGYRWGDNLLEVSGAPSGRVPRFELVTTLGVAAVWK